VRDFETAARAMAPLIETPCWLIPIPASDGSTRANAILAPDFRLLPFPLRVNPCNPCLPSPPSAFFLLPSAFIRLQVAVPSGGPSAPVLGHPTGHHPTVTPRICLIATVCVASVWLVCG